MDVKLDEVDRLSSLPDSILVHILSFLPTLVAVRTMLIKRFSTLWTSLPNLDLDDLELDIWHNEDPDYVEMSDNDDDGCSSLNLAFFIFVRNILMRHGNPQINKFRVNISEMYYSDIEERNLGSEIDSWIDFALRKRVKILQFSVGMVEPCEPLYKLPHAEFVSDSLVELRLEFLEMKLQQRVQMGNLRVLRLIRVDISEAVFTEIIQGCPLLQELEIFNCIDMNELRFDALNIEKLILDTTEHYNFGHILEINCPILKSFEFTGFVDCVEIINLQSLVLATVDLRCRQVEFLAFSEFMAVLKQLLSAKIVKLSCEFVTVLFYCMLKHLPCIITNWNLMELSMWLTDKHIHGLCRLLTNSPDVEKLFIKITSWHSDFLEQIESDLDSCNMDTEDYYWNSLKSVTVCNISMCLFPVLIHLVKTLLKHAVALDELVIYYDANGMSSDEGVLSSEQWAEFSEELPGFFKASRTVRVLLL